MLLEVVWWVDLLIHGHIFAWVYKCWWKMLTLLADVLCSLYKWVGKCWRVGFWSDPLFTRTHTQLTFLNPLPHWLYWTLTHSLTRHWSRMQNFDLYQFEGLDLGGWAWHMGVWKRSCCVLLPSFSSSRSLPELHH